MQLYQLIGKVLGVDPLTLSEESNAQNTPKWDSLRHIEVIFAVESAYQVRFTMPEIAGLRNLGDMRRLLEAMRGDDEPERVPHPGLADLGGLIDRVRAAGLAVGLQVDGEPVDLPAGLDLSVYRIVQEALTNTLRHAGARRAEVALVFGPHDLRVEVRDDGRGPVDGDAGGHGLVGIQERVKIYGGEMSAAGTPGGGFVLRARLPMDGDGS